MISRKPLFNAKVQNTLFFARFRFDSSVLWAFGKKKIKYQWTKFFWKQKGLRSVSQRGVRMASARRIKKFYPPTKNDREYDVYCKPRVQRVGIAVLCKFSVTVVYTKFCVSLTSFFAQSTFCWWGVLNKISCEKLGKM